MVGVSGARRTPARLLLGLGYRVPSHCALASGILYGTTGVGLRGEIFDICRFNTSKRVTYAKKPYIDVK